MSHLERVQDIVASVLGWEPSHVTPEKRLQQDLSADSLDQVELLMACEEEFGIEIPDEDAFAWGTVADVVKYLENRTGNPPA